MKQTKLSYRPDAPLRFAAQLSDIVNEAWGSGRMQEQVTPLTAELLRYWFDPDICGLRHLNFHAGQRQAILNVIYLHEVEKEEIVGKAIYKVAPDLLMDFDLQKMAQPKYKFPKYCVKMATGTGKTWVMEALMLWQILNALHQDEPSGRFTKNFLIIAPNLIVYDRLQDAFLGRSDTASGARDADKSDFQINQELFIPPQYRHEAFSFIQNNVVTKEDGIGRKLTGGGLIALTNWQWFETQIDEVQTAQSEEDNEEIEDSEGFPTYPLTGKALVNALLPVRPGKAAGNDLNVLDNRWQRGIGLDYLASLPDIMVINDEAHHIHGLKRQGDVEEVEWQQGLDIIAQGKGTRFFQLDFSATPYSTIGSGEKITKIYFPHIVVNFELVEAIRLGLVKLVLIDKRQELTDLGNLDYYAVRDTDNRVLGLSSGQRLMLRAGLTKLRILEKDFTDKGENKSPKMLVVCEDTGVTPFVEDFLINEGLEPDDILTIDSTRKGELKPDEWRKLKARLFDIDRRRRPKVIVSVLMLREGFDINNICVLVPLRSAQSSILLEQLIGRGLRLMWREPEYQSIKAEDRDLLLNKRKEPKTYFDTLSIIEHPKFIDFYEELQEAGVLGEDSGDVGTGGAAGDILPVHLRENYADYDFQWPVIIHDAEQELSDSPIDIQSLLPFTLFRLETLKHLLATKGETFLSQEIITETDFGRYSVSRDIFDAKSYNEYLLKLLRAITRNFSRRGKGSWPTMQINNAAVAAAIDTYIRTQLFSQPFDPFQDNNWTILLSRSGVVTQHIVKQFAGAIYKAQQQQLTTSAQVETIPFSSVKTIRMREKYSMPTVKTIYERQGWPTHGGGLEKEFMKMLEQDADVLSWLKIDENQHPFAQIFYIRKDGLLATYHPDFLVAAQGRIFLIETKGEDKKDDPNVRQKQVAATEWVRKINTLEPADRMHSEWAYVLISEQNFLSLRAGNAGLLDICRLCLINPATARGNLFE